MILNYRHTQPRDLSECYPLIEDRSYYTPVEQSRLLSFWRYLLKGRMANSVVVEDLGRPLGRRILFFGMTVFVSDDFSRGVRTTFPPPLSRRLFESWLQGRQYSLGRKEIAWGNSKEGLNLALIHIGYKQGLSPHEMIPLNFRVQEAFFQFHSGFQIKEYMLDIFTEEHGAAIANHDGRVVRKYGGGPIRVPREGSLKPLYLMGAKRDEEARPTGRSSLLNLFHAARPRFGFSAGEKDVLEKALFGETDKQISRSLDLTLWAIKKRWQGVYEKVERLHPQLLLSTSGPPDDLPKDSKAERRRYLLDYLRHHLEEIRPTLTPHRKNAAVKSSRA